MFFEYALYLAFSLAGTFLLGIVFQVIQTMELRRVLLGVLIPGTLFLVWDIFAVIRGHWSFDPAYNFGFFVLNQPLEEIAFFIVIPFFYLVVWEIVKKNGGKSSWNTRF